jgi:dTDP-glucose 4,6-dehydratase
MKRVMITGGCGFIGHHVVEHFLRETDWRIDVLDKLTYAAVGLDRVRDINAFDDKRVNFYTADLAGDIPVGVLRELSSINYILHLGAETHVDNSITDPEPFIVSNVLGTMHLLNFARKLDNLEAFCYFSTDEVFGPAPPGIAYKEWDRYDSSNPYAASKAGGEELVLAYANTYKLPTFITHTMNAFGERQHPEKFIPLVMRKVLAGEKVYIHSDATKTVSGSRFYIHCRNIAKAVHFLLDTFTTRDKYNIVGEVEVSNYHLASMIADIIGKPLVYEFVDFHSSRPGHDLRYALDGTKMKNMGWEVPMTFEESLERTIRWTLKPENKNWLMLEK